MQQSKNVTLLGPTQVNKGDLIDVLHYAPTLVAVDGGAKNAVKLGQTPEIVIGDFDSIDKNTLVEIPESRLQRIPDQESTDLDKALANITAPLILALGFLGGRLDHQMAVLNSLCRSRQQQVILVGEHEVAFLCSGHVQLGLANGTRVSLFPMSIGRVSATGVKWPWTNQEVAPNGVMSISNEAEAEVVAISATADLFVMLPRSALAVVITALQPQ